MLLIKDVPQIKNFQNWSKFLIRGIFLEWEKLHLGIRQMLSKKSCVPNFRDAGGRRRHENGAFGTEIFRRIRQERSRSPKIPPKRKT